LQAELGAVQGMTTAPQAPPAGQPATPAEDAPPPEYEVLATMRLSTYVPTAIREDVSELPGEEPVAAGSMDEVHDES
jgi:hypothetical protein